MNFKSSGKDKIKTNKTKKQKQRDRELPGLTSTHLPVAGPASPAQPTTASFPVVFLLCQKDGRVPDACAPQCGHLHPAWLPPRRSGPSLRRHATSPTPSSSLSCLSPPLVLSPSRARAPPSPPPAVPVATETPSPLRAVHGLHLHLSRLSVSSHDAGRPASPSTLPSSSSLPQDHRRPHDLIIPSPSPLSLSSHPP